MSALLSKLMGFLSSWKALAIAALLVLLAGTNIYTHVHTKHKAELACAQTQSTAVTQGTSDNAQTEKEIIQLPDPDLDNRLSKWMRD